MNTKAHDEAGTDPEKENAAPDSGAETDWQEEALKFRDSALRARAELENYRKRISREKEEAIRYANASLLEKLLSVIDNFELGLEAARGAGEASGILQGMEMVSKQLQDFLTAQGVRVVDAAGQAFDPAVHEAVAHEPSSEVPEGHVVRQIRKGYTLKDRLLRPATVTVSKGAPDA